MEIREVTKKERSQAFELAWTVFQKFEAPEYSEEGIETFRKCLKDPAFVDQMKVYGAFLEKELAGVLATRKEGNHIALFFVKEQYHRQGIGRKLFEKACEDNKTGKLTVNAAPYAVEVYHHLGFRDLDVEQLEDGIRYTPMAYEYIKNGE